jgi:hypothetical protein
MEPHIQNQSVPQRLYNTQFSNNGRVIYGDAIHRYSNAREAEESDSDTELQDDMPEGWNAAQNPENDPYYVGPINQDSSTRTTTWIKPMLNWAPADVLFREELARTFEAVLQPEPDRSESANAHEPSLNTTGQDYYAGIEARARINKTAWPSRDVMFPPPSMGLSHCSVFTEGIPVLVDEKIPSKGVEALVQAMKEKKDSICIIENINGHWIQALGAASELDIPHEFFARQASSRTTQPVRQGTYIPSMDDIIERVLPLGRRILRKKKEESVKKIINTLCEASVVIKTSVDNWMLYGVTSHELNRAASFVAECTSVLGKLKETATSVGRSANKNSPKSEPISARALHRQMADLEFLRLRRFFNLYATYEFQEHVPFNYDLRRVTSSFFARNARQTPSFTASGPRDDTNSMHGRYSSDTQISYIRVDKTLCKSFIIGTSNRY